MTVIVVGIIIIIIGFVAAKSDSPLFAYRSMIKTAGVIVVLIGMSIACVVQVEPGEVGVQKLFGKVNNNILESGLNVINPLVQVVMFDVRTENYTMSAVQDEGSKQGDDAIRVLTADGLEVVIDLTVLYKVVPAEAPRILKRLESITGMFLFALFAGQRSGIMPFIMMQLHFTLLKEMSFSQGFFQLLKQTSKNADCCLNSCW